MPQTDNARDRRTLRWLAPACCAIGFAAAAPVVAQAEKPVQADAWVEDFRECRALVEASARLGCFDAISDQLVLAIDQGELRIIDRDAVKKTERRLFGFALPDLKLFGGDNAGKPLEVLETTVVESRSAGQSSWAFTTPEGGTWQIDSAPDTFRRPKPGASVVIKRAALGSYFISFNGGRSLRARRTE